MAKAFNKFIKQGETGSQKKERIRQEKKQVRKETQAYFAKKKEEYKQQKQAKFGQRSGDDTPPKGGYGSNYAGKSDDRKASTGKPSYTKRYQPKTSYRKKTDKDTFDQTPVEKPKYIKGPSGKPAYARTSLNKSGYAKASADKPGYNKTTADKPPIEENNSKSSFTKAPVSKGDVMRKESIPSGQMPLNKFIAHAGVCARRDAAELVKSGKVVVNGKLITEPGFKVTTKDEVKVNGKQVMVRRNLVYILLNKPKDFITTTEDPQGRKTVLDIIKNATPERVYPVGRLDRNTTGVLLLTNDGELAQKLSHPSYEIKKIYEVTLDKPLLKKDFDIILKGVTLEDGFISPDVLAYADPKDKKVIGIEIHSGRNRIVRRIFEAVGYDVRNLDRVMYANLTKKNVERGKWRFLSEKEVRLLKYLNASFAKNKPAARG